MRESVIGRTGGLLHCLVDRRYWGCEMTTACAPYIEGK